jgi:hypothetical protein
MKSRYNFLKRGYVSGVKCINTIEAFIKSQKNITMKKFLVKLGLWKKSVPVKIEMGKAIVKSMTGNPDFPSPPFTMAALAAIVQALEDAFIARANHGGGTLFTSVIEEKENIYDEAMRSMWRYVNTASGGNEAVIRSAGMDVRKQRGKAQVPAAASSVSAEPGLLSGSIDLRWKRPAYALAHNIYMTDDIENPASWKLEGQTTNTRFTRTGLEPLKIYWLKVEAIGSAGVGAASDPAMTHAAM